MEKLQLLSRLSVRNLSGEVVPMANLWSPGGAVVYVIRRMG